jgi:tripartite-type tricarboxylate transporter receptor subunit TctC
MALKNLLIAAASTLLLLPLASAQEYPSKPIRIIVPGATGTGLDITTRYFSERLSKGLNTSVLVENREGAGSAIGLAHAAKAMPDGYTLVSTGINVFVVPHVSEAPVGFDPAKDFTPVVRVNGSAFVIVVPASSPHLSLKDLVRAMAAKPRTVTFASGGFGTTSLMCAAQLNEMTNTTARHIPYRGNTQAVTDTVGGQVDFTCSSAVLLPLIKAGKLRALAVTSAKRWDDLPDVPTVQEAGIPGYELSSWIGVMAPAGTPAAIVQKLSDQFVSIAQSREFKDFCADRGLYVDIVGHKEFQAEIPKEVAKWKQLAQLSKEK